MKNFLKSSPLACCVVTVVLVSGAVVFAAQESGGGAAKPVLSCKEFLVPKQTVNGKLVGQEDCRMQEVSVTIQGRKYRRVDMAVDGTVAGATTREGMMAEYFTDGPEILFPHFGQKGWIPGVARYEGSAGVGMIVMYPEDASAWNGKLFINIHGAGLCAWGGSGRTDLDRYHSEPLSDFSKYDLTALEKGYAVARARRTVSGINRWGNIAATEDDVRRCSSAKLDDGTTLIDVNFTDHAGLHLGFIALVDNFLKGRLGKDVARNYWYGHSSGARVGRLVNYLGLNPIRNGKPMIDGFLSDDSAAGQWLPRLFRGGKDVLFTTPQERDKFVKQIDLSHKLYINWFNNPMPNWGSGVYLVNKLNNAKLLQEKGLGTKHRMFEIRGVSHSGSDSMGGGGSAGDIKGIDLSRLMEAQLDLLDNWVEKGIEPPANRSDWDYEWAERASKATRTSGVPPEKPISESGAIALPEVACPLGVYFAYPYSRGRQGAGITSFAAFDGNGLEPLDGRDIPVDMNGNGKRDNKETVTQAWRRLGLLKADETFTREKYVACVKSVTERLKRQGLLTEKGASSYVDDASKASLPSENR